MNNLTANNYPSIKPNQKPKKLKNITIIKTNLNNISNSQTLN